MSCLTCNLLRRIPSISVPIVRDGFTTVYHRVCGRGSGRQSLRVGLVWRAFFVDELVPKRRMPRLECASRVPPRNYREVVHGISADASEPEELSSLCR